MAQEAGQEALEVMLSPPRPWSTDSHVPGGLEQVETDLPDSSVGVFILISGLRSSLTCFYRRDWGSSHS